MKKSPLKGRPWSEEAKAKARATRAAKLAAASEPHIPTRAPETIKDAIVFLRAAEREATKALKSGKIKSYDAAHLHAILALRLLESL